MAKKKIKKMVTKTIPWKITPFFIDMDEKQFQERISIMPVKILLNEYAIACEEIGKIIAKFPDKYYDKKEYLDISARAYDLKMQVMKRFHELEDHVEVMDYYRNIDC
jgi:hypothetical protein